MDGVEINGVEIATYLAAMNTLSLFDNVNVKQVQQLTSGQCNVNLKVEQGGQYFVVRFLSHFDRINPRDRQQECLMQQLAADNQLAPLVVSHFELTELINQNSDVWLAFESMFSGVMVSEFVQGDDWGSVTNINERELSMLAMAVAKLHAISIEKKAKRLTTVPLSQQLSLYWQYYVNNTPLVPKSVKRLIKRLKERLSVITPVDCCLIHGDLNPSNIMMTDHVIFIDWEYGDYGDRYIDLASVIVEFDFCASQKSVFLAKYAECSNMPIDEDYFEVVIDYYCGLCWLWTVSNNADGAQRYYQRLILSQQRFDNISECGSEF